MGEESFKGMHGKRIAFVENNCLPHSSLLNLNSIKRDIRSISQRLCGEVED